MKLASYKGTHSGISGLGNIAIRLRLSSIYSHSELIFEPKDRVREFMPDGTMHDLDHSPWCFSSSAIDIMPEWSPIRAGRKGGCRFKRIKLDLDNWDLLEIPYDINEIRTARLATKLQGKMYDWQGIFGYLAWPIPDKADRYTCSEAIAEVLECLEPFRYNPPVLHSAVQLSGRN